MNAGLVYLRARYYEPDTMRFIQQDTYWNPGNMIYGDDPLPLNGYTLVPDIHAIMQSTNLYVFAMNNPILFIDPSGFKTVVFCYNNPGSGFEEQVKNSVYFNYKSDDVEVIYVISSQDFIDAWNNLDDSDLLAAYGATIITGKNIFFGVIQLLRKVYIAQNGHGRREFI